MAYTFEQLLAADPSNPSNIAQNGSITIFAPGDPTMTPLTITDPDGSPLPNPFTVNANGFGPAFAHATLDRVAWSGGGFTGFVTSYEGMKEEAVAAREAAEQAKAEAAAAAVADLEARISAGQFKGDPGTPGAPGVDGINGTNGINGANVLPTQEAIAEALANPGPAKTTLTAEVATQTAGKVDKIGIPINVKDLGAVGDGTANDSAIIQSALNSSRAVFIPEGTWRLSAATGFALANTSQRRRTIYGAGQGLTVLKLDSGGEGGVIDSTGATLADLSIDGGFNPATAQANLLSCVQANSNSTVRNVHIYNARGSCLVGVGSRIQFINNRLEKFGDHAIYFSGDIGTTAPYNILATSSRIIVSGNIIDDDPTYHNGAAGGPVRGAIKLRNNVSDVSITGNTVHGDQCVLIDGDTRRAEACPRGVVITGNTFIASSTGVHLNTTIDPAAGDLGFRVNDVQIGTNKFTATDTTNVGVVLSRARASIKGNIFRTVDGVSNNDTGDTGASIIEGNYFFGSTGIYKAGTGSRVQGNIFEGLTGGWGVQYTYHGTVCGNSFIGCNVGVVLRSTSHATNIAVLQDNMFMNNTLAIDIGEFARSAALLDNTFTGNTTTATVVSGSAFNVFATNNNRVLSGAAWPSTGSGDGVVLAPAGAIVTVSTLPTAVADLRGKMVRVNGAAGVADQVYICRKNAANTYEWAAVL